jgi:mannose-6-phosphate isomerase-like protein (cupin superfamily)
MATLYSSSGRETDKTRRHRAWGSEELVTVRKDKDGKTSRGAGGAVKVVRLNKAKSLKGDRSRSYQLINPDNVGSRRFMITLVEIRPGGSTPAHEHRTVESMYYILEGRGQVQSTSGRAGPVVGPKTAVHFPAGSTHGIRNIGRTKLVYLSCHAPPYEIEDLYRHWGAGEFVTTGG